MHLSNIENPNLTDSDVLCNARSGAARFDIVPNCQYTERDPVCHYFRPVNGCNVIGGYQGPFQVLSLYDLIIKIFWFFAIASILMMPPINKFAYVMIAQLP